MVELGQVGCSKVENRDPQEITDAKVDDHGEFYRIVGSTGGIAFSVVMAIVPGLTMLMIGIWFFGSWACKRLLPLGAVCICYSSFGGA